MDVRDILLGRYEVTDIIGIGGEATLARAKDTVTGQEVVLKKLDASPDHSHFAVFLARFRRAGQLVIGHPNVLDPLGCAEQDGLWYLILPYVPGVTLEILVSRRRGPPPIQETLFLLKGLAEGLAAVHQQGVVHRDLKPSNIIVGQDGNPVIIDFGVCRIPREATITVGQGMLGSIRYMAPEQLVNPTTVDERADLYSLGAVLYYMLVGRPPFDGSTPAAIIGQLQSAQPVPPRQANPAVPAFLNQLCMRLLAKDPNGRPQTAQETVAAISSQSHDATFCPSCGLQQPGRGKFCPRCGAALVQSSQPASACMACGVSVNGEAGCPGCGRPFSPANHRFVFFAGALAGEVRRIPEGIFVCGRSELLSRDRRISRRQLHVACSNGRVQIQDAGSANKTYVNGQLATTPTLLQPGQTVVIAANVATYLSE